MKHLLLDIGGVLMRIEDYAPGIANLKEKYGVEGDVEDVLIKKNSEKLDMGVMKFSENIKMLNESMKKKDKNYIPISEKQYYHALFSKSNHNTELIEHLKNIKNLKIHIFTNNHQGFLRNHTKNMKFNEWTDSIISSHEHNVIKPDPRFFNIALDKIGASPGECILLDDNPKNIAVAKELGMKTVLYTDNINTVKELRELMSGKIKKEKVVKKNMKKVRTSKKSRPSKHLKITKKQKTSKILRGSKKIKKNKTALLVHGWDGDPRKGWFSWLKKELENKNFKVIMPIMPDPQAPKIDSWIKKLETVTKDADHFDLIVGHSVGCQTIMRYLAKTGKKCDKAVFVAPWFGLKESAYKEYPNMEEEIRNIARPWIKTPIDFKKIKIKRVLSIFSDNDPYVALTNAKIMRSVLKSEIIIKHDKKHLSESYIKKIEEIIKFLED